VGGVGSAYVTGFTGSTDFPTTAGAFQPTPAGGDAFVAKIQFAAIRPIADTYVRAGTFSTNNFGSLPLLYAKKGAAADNTRRSYLKFDISSLGSVQRATLRVRARLSAATAPIKVTMYAVDNVTWDEQTLTWNTRPDLGAVLRTFLVSGTAPSWLDVDVTAFVRAQVQAGRNSISIALRSVDHTSAFAQFDSREAGADSPQLVVTR
jgi:hypothetical protein